MDRFTRIYDMASESFDTDVYIKSAFESHLNDLRDMCDACEAIGSPKGLAAKAGAAIKQFVANAGKRIMDMINSIISGIDNMITRMRNMSARKDIQVQKKLKENYDALAGFIKQVEDGSREHIVTFVEASNLRKILTDPSGLDELDVARAKLMDFNHEVSEKLQKLSSEMPNKDAGNVDWIDARNKQDTVAFNPAAAQTFLNKSRSYWKNVQHSVKSGLTPLNNMNANLNIGISFMKDNDPETDNTRKVYARIRNIIGNSYSATMSLVGVMLKAISFLSKIIAGFISADKKFSGITDKVEGKVVDRTEKSHEKAQDRFKALTAHA